ncbi:hypothetical protein CBR_g27781 [Chara braunii]|uniref:EndoU domain-containing protein n=1 Tax=Chara braunii TaxID=69332 RepID=A0A388L8D5_CHABU|nr:hypothetical protein CBR_g27781 [Chara braunii]|eukprot:GBG78557.1 hypothetical protein CBR_g27781 [Chara braunii]
MAWNYKASDSSHGDNGDWPSLSVSHSPHSPVPRKVSASKTEDVDDRHRERHHSPVGEGKVGGRWSGGGRRTHAQGEEAHSGQPSPSASNNAWGKPLTSVAAHATVGSDDGGRPSQGRDHPDGYRQGRDHPEGRCHGSKESPRSPSEQHHSSPRHEEVVSSPPHSAWSKPLPPKGVQNGKGEQVKVHDAHSPGKAAAGGGGGGGGGSWAAIAGKGSTEAEGKPVGRPSSGRGGRCAGAPSPREMVRALYAKVTPAQMEPTREELNDISLAAARLWELDVNRLVPDKDYQIECGQGKTSYNKRDMAKDSLFQYVDPQVFQRPTYKTFMALLDNYNPDVLSPESVTAAEIRENAFFLTAALESPCLKYVHRWLVEQRLAPSRPEDFKSFLGDLWFTVYNRGGGRGSSSAFEHVFVGEVSGDVVKGFHNWIQFYILEKNKMVDYMGFILPRRRGEQLPDRFDQVMQIQFEWGDDLKEFSTLFIGVSPEFELALYTMCFLSGMAEVQVDMGGYDLKVISHRMPNGKLAACYADVL